jgi:hypothetical protein
MVNEQAEAPGPDYAVGITWKKATKGAPVITS